MDGIVNVISANVICKAVRRAMIIIHELFARLLFIAVVKKP